MEDIEQYKSLISDIIAKQAVILGPDMAVLKAKNVPELSVDPVGKVMAITGDPQVALKKIVDQYVELSGQIVKNALGSVFQKYPSIKRIE